MQLANNSRTGVKNSGRLSGEPSIVGGTRPDNIPALELRAAVEKSLPVLNDLHAVTEVYGLETNARKLLKVINQLQAALPAPKETSESLTFLVNTRFSVERQRVAELLQLGYEAGNWFKIVAEVPPEEMLFRADSEDIIEELDYPLNKGGSLELSVAQKDPACFRLNLETIARGLEVLSARCPRHFADFLNGTEDRITGSIFLQCCLFGDLIYE